MPSLGVHASVAAIPKPAGLALPGPGPEELTAVLGYLKPKDIEQIEQAYQVARAAHSGQYRQSGEPYITHPLAVAKILAEWHLDAQAMMAARCVLAKRRLLGGGWLLPASPMAAERGQA